MASWEKTKRGYSLIVRTSSKIWTYQAYLNYSEVKEVWVLSYRSHIIDLGRTASFGSAEEAIRKIDNDIRSA